MASIDVQIDPAKLAEIEKKCAQINEAKINAAVNRAAKRAADSAKTETRKQTTAQYTITAAHVGKTITVKRNSGKGIKGASMIVRDTPVALPQFTGTKPNKPAPKNPKPQKINVRKDTGVKVIPGWFPAQMKSGHIGIFERVGKKRLPVEQHAGPGTANTFNNPEVEGKVTLRAQEVLSKRLEHEIGRLLESK